MLYKFKFGQPVIVTDQSMASQAVRRRYWFTFGNGKKSAIVCFFSRLNWSVLVVNTNDMYPDDRECVYEMPFGLRYRSGKVVDAACNAIRMRHGK